MVNNVPSSEGPAQDRTVLGLLSFLLGVSSITVKVKNKTDTLRNARLISSLRYFT